MKPLWLFWPCTRGLESCLMIRRRFVLARAVAASLAASLAACSAIHHSTRSRARKFKREATTNLCSREGTRANLVFGFFRYARELGYTQFLYHQKVSKLLMTLKTNIWTTNKKTVMHRSAGVAATAQKEDSTLDLFADSGCWSG